MIKVNVVNQDGPKLIRKDFDRERVNFNIRILRIAITAQALAKVRLSEALGDKFKHFSVNIFSTGVGMSISVSPVDNIGGYFYNGTPAHDIVAGSKAMPMPDGGFSRKVRHPGTKAYKPIINRIVMESMYAAMAMVR